MNATASSSYTPPGTITKQIPSTKIDAVLLVKCFKAIRWSLVDFRVRSLGFCHNESPLAQV